MKFRKIPHIVDAVQWFPGKNVEGVFSEMSISSAGVFIMNSFGSIKTLEGIMTVSPGDWVVTGVKGEKWPVKPDIFSLTYEKVNEAGMPDSEPIDVTPISEG